MAVTIDLDEPRYFVTASVGVRLGWAQAPEYLFRALPGHAIRAQTVDRLLDDVAYVMHADLGRPAPPGAHQSPPRGTTTSNIPWRRIPAAGRQAA